MAGEKGQLLSPPLSATKAHFRESINLIPTPVHKPKRYEPPQLKLWLILPASLFMIALGIALEVALSISQRKHGFSVPERNAFKFASQQFLTSFVPICFVAPLALLWESKNWLVKRYQPYINLAKGNASADDSILLDYITLNPVYAIYLAFIKRHWLVFISSAVGLSTLALQPLAGSIFDVIQFAESNPSEVTSVRTLGLDPTFGQLTNFLASAGYVQAAVSNNLTDPPFINANWAAADFNFPTGAYLNGTVTTNTVGIRTNATCTAPSSLTLVTNSTTDYTITAGSAQSCQVIVNFNPQDASSQYGVNPVPNCGPHAGLSQAFQPVFFWFFRMNNPGQQAQATGVFCSPTLEVFNIQVNASLDSGEMGKVTILSPFTEQNNVTGTPQNGVPFNAVVFDPAPDNFTAARAIATNNGVPGAILHAIQLGNTSQTAFNGLDGFLNKTSAIYTQHLALVAKNTYFLTASQTISSTTTSLRPRLVLEPLASHALAVFLILIGLMMLFVGLRHHQVRKGVYLAAAPGSIASAVALTSRSGFGELLVPYDTEHDIAAKMQQLLFALDHRTGAIETNDRPGASFLSGSRYADDTMDKEAGSMNSPNGSLHRGRSMGSADAHQLNRTGYQIEPFTPPIERAD